MILEHLLLGMLREPASGYRLKQVFGQSVAHFWSCELSQIYPTLKRMEQNGWVRSRLEPSPHGPDRRVYERTEAGRDELLRWLQLAPIVGTERFGYLVQLFFMSELKDLHATLAFLTQLREKLANWLAQLQAIKGAAQEQNHSAREVLDDEDFHGYLTLRMGIHSLTAKVAWCDESIEWVRQRLGDAESTQRPQRHNQPAAGEQHSTCKQTKVQKTRKENLSRENNQNRPESDK